MAEIKVDAKKRHEAVEGVAPMDGFVHVDQLPQEDGNLIRRTEEAGLNAIASLYRLPDPYYEMMMLCTKKEEHSAESIKQDTQKARRRKQDMDLLNKFSAGLNSHKPDTELSADMKGILAQLKEQNIDIWNGTGSLSKEKIGELRHTTGSQIDNAKTDIQSIMATSIQPKLTALAPVLDTMKKAAENRKRVVDAANRLPGH